MVLRTNLSPEAKPARLPVRGVMKPMVIVQAEDELPEPLIPDPQALSTPPAPAARAPTPRPPSTERRATECSGTGCSGTGLAAALSGPVDWKSTRLNSTH